MMRYARVAIVCLVGTLCAGAASAQTKAPAATPDFDGGVRYHVPGTPMVHPYVAFGVGAASVKSETVFSVNGAVTDPASLGIQSGTDTNGSLTKALVTIGLGADINFKTRYFADVS